MRERMRKAVASGAVALIVGGSLVIPASAQAETIKADCGQTVTAKPGDQIQTPFGLQTVVSGVTSLVGGLLGGLCKVTVTLVDTVVAPVPVAGPPLAGAVDNTVAGATKGLTNATNGVAGAVSPKPPQQQPVNQTPPSSPVNQTGPQEQAGPTGSTGAPAVNGQASPAANQPSANSLFGFGYWSTNLFDPSFTGYAPMRDYGFLPMAMPGVFSPSPSFRYGQTIPGSPDFSALDQILGPAAGKNTQPEVRTAGHAEALPQQENNPVRDLGLPLLLAVLALTGVGAILIRAWVLRRTAH